MHPLLLSLSSLRGWPYETQTEHNMRTVWLRMEHEKRKPKGHMLFMQPFNIESEFGTEGDTAMNETCIYNFAKIQNVLTMHNATLLELLDRINRLEDDYATLAQEFLKLKNSKSTLKPKESTHAEVIKIE